MPLWIFLLDFFSTLAPLEPQWSSPFHSLPSCHYFRPLSLDKTILWHAANCKVDVDDSDTRIVYSPAASWTHQTNAPKVQGDQLYYMATNSYARAQGASATFKFTGVVCPLYSAYHFIAVSHIHFLGHRILGYSTILWSYNSDRWRNSELGNRPELLYNHRCLPRIQYIRRAYNYYNGFHLRYRGFVKYQSWQIPVSTRLGHDCRV